jgi:hypothetical protein
MGVGDTSISKKEGEVRRGLRWWDHRGDQRRSSVRRDQGCLRIQRALG